MSEWIQWSGGENPAPGMIVEIKTYDGRYSERPSERVVWGLADIGGTLISPVAAYRLSRVSYERYAELTARVKRMEEALRPFAAMADGFNDAIYPTPNKDADILYGRETKDGSFRMTIGDLRRARAAYNGETDANQGGAS